MGSRVAPPGCFYHCYTNIIKHGTFSLYLCGIYQGAYRNVPGGADLWYSSYFPDYSEDQASERIGTTGMSDEVKQRKIEHVNVALGQDVSAPQRANWQDVQFVHQALPEVDLDAIDTSVTFLGHKLRYPIFVSSLTGGHPDVTSINRNLARAAEQYGLALGVGSQRAAIVNPDVASSYAVTRE